MGQGSSTRSADTAYDNLLKHREQLFARQLEYHKQCQQTRQQAEEQLRIGNRVGALNLARQLKTLESQQATVAGLVNNLDSQRASLETHKITQRSMTVIAECVKNLGKSAVSVQHVDALVDASEDVTDDLREVAEALSLPYDAGCTEEDLLKLLGTGSGTAKPQNTEGRGGSGQDELFLQWLRDTAELGKRADTLPVLPDVPKHSLSVPTQASVSASNKRERAFVM